MTADITGLAFIAHPTDNPFTPKPTPSPGCRQQSPWVGESAAPHGVSVYHLSSMTWERPVIGLILEYIGVRAMGLAAPLGSAASQEAAMKTDLTLDKRAPDHRPGSLSQGDLSGLSGRCGS